MSSNSLEVAEAVDALGQTPAENSTEVSLDYFLYVMEEVKKVKLSIDAQKDLENFEAILYAKNLCAISGSSILFKRLNITDQFANDIDIFINGDEYLINVDVAKVIKCFFDNKELKKAFEQVDTKFSYKQTQTPKPDLSFFSNTNSYNFYLDNDISQEYGLDKEEVRLSTSKAYIGNDIILNFILIKNNYSEKRAEKEPWFKTELRHQLYIQEQFDFEELKYIYDFTRAEIIDIYKFSERTLNDAINEYPKSCPLDKATNFFLNNQINASARFLEKYGHTSKDLHLSPRLFDSHMLGLTFLLFGEETTAEEFYDFNHALGRLRLGDRELIRDIKRFLESYSRFEKYDLRGFNIIDTNMSLASVSVNLNVLAYKISNDKMIDRINRRSLFCNSNKSNGNKGRQIKFFNSLKNLWNKVISTKKDKAKEVKDG